MTKYQTHINELGYEFIVKNSIAWIPKDPANTDYQQYLAWLEEGNEPEEWTDGN